MRLISWHVDCKGNRLAGIEDIMTGWAVIDSKANRIYESTDYSRESRDTIEERYGEEICRMKRITKSSKQSK